MTLHSLTISSRDDVTKLVIGTMERGPGGIKRARDAIARIDTARVAAGGSLDTLAASLLVND